MKRNGLIALTVAVGLCGGAGVAQELPTEGTSADVTSPNADVPYIGVDGTFTLDTTVPSSLHDPRNPARIVFERMENFSFYRDMAGQDPIAENCTYTYRGAAPDPFYYPQYQTSIWDLFELTSEDMACSGFKYVALRSPHGEPAHMHLRYGGETSSFETLLNMSTGESDSESLDPWWSLYCAEGVTACDL
ncbi:hypothetical protein IQ268_23660 [Oculatella sp. LEGE 06141]|uniref:hypothetical protein n=1 Tax=Oculatella sp. LEGE 06141 TaxID=1828648 RepID=UPI00187E19B5|nr:hypothetical protein [Oculatella sp. LEGE 06141]MBE9181564.1 hypothetical protein [Oculatella sp. LEGE 06141]